MKDLADRKGAALLYGTNFSVGVQAMLKLASQMAQALGGAGYNFSIDETHHTSKLDAPSGTAITLQGAVKSVGDVPIASHRVGDAPGLHTLEARTESERSGVDPRVLQPPRFRRRRSACGGMAEHAHGHL